VLICKDVDEEGRWYFASDAASVKGRDLAANPRAAASFYWPQQGRQIRISGAAASAGSEASAADFLARPPASRAAALIGRQSEPLDDPAKLDEAFRQSQAEVDADPGLVAPAGPCTRCPLTRSSSGRRITSAGTSACSTSARTARGAGACSGRDQPGGRRPAAGPGEAMAGAG
jgi:hypothetical protein